MILHISISAENGYLLRVDTEEHSLRVVDLHKQCKRHHHEILYAWRYFMTVNCDVLYGKFSRLKCIEHFKFNTKKLIKCSFFYLMLHKRVKIIQRR